MRVHGGRPGLRAGNRKRGDQAAPRTPHPALSSLQQAGEPRWTSRKRSGSKRRPTTPQKKFPLKMSGPVTSGPACPFQQSDHRERGPWTKRPRSFSEQSPPPCPGTGCSSRQALEVRGAGAAGHLSSEGLGKASLLLSKCPREASRHLSAPAHRV